MSKCCYEHSNSTFSCVEETSHIVLCLLPFLIFLCIPFTIISFLIYKSMSIKNKGVKKISQIKSLKKGKPDNVYRVCSICQEKILFSNLLILDCQHFFHKKCIQEWFKRKDTCPICRHNISII